MIFFFSYTVPPFSHDGWRQMQEENLPYNLEDLTVFKDGDVARLANGFGFWKSSARSDTRYRIIYPAFRPTLLAPRVRPSLCFSRTH